MDYQYLEEKICEWAANEYGSYGFIYITDTRAIREKVDEDFINYYDSCRVMILFGDRTFVKYWVSVTPDLGELVFQKIL